MKASGLIEKLSTAISEAGDLDILLRYPEDGTSWENFSVVPDPPTPMEEQNGVKGTIDINAVGDGGALPELKEYSPYDEGGFWRDLTRAPDAIPGNQLGRYEIIFNVAGQRYYCFADAGNMNEALGQFFAAHPHITYGMIVDHMEV